MRIGFIFLSLLLFSSCNKKEMPANILEPDMMVEVFWDYLQIDVFTKDFLAKDSTKIPEIEHAALQKKMFDKYGISKENFYDSYQYYAKDEKLMKTLLDSITSKKRKILKKPELKKAKLNEKIL